MKRSIIATGAASLLMLVGACCGCHSSKSQSRTLSGNSWRLVELSDGQKLAGSEEDSYTVTFDAAEGRIFGRGGCNSYFGGYKELPSHRLELSPMGSTRMMCPNQDDEDIFYPQKFCRRATL